MAKNLADVKQNRIELLYRPIWTKEEAKEYMGLSNNRSQHYFKLLPERKNLGGNDILRDDFLTLFQTSKEKEINFLTLKKE